jgi:hypothetical protein
MADIFSAASTMSRSGIAAAQTLADLLRRWRHEYWNERAKRLPPGSLDHSGHQISALLGGLRSYTMTMTTLTELIGRGAPLPEDGWL